MVEVNWEAVKVAYFGGLSLSQTAKLMGVNKSTVKDRCTRYGWKRERDAIQAKVEMAHAVQGQIKTASMTDSPVQKPSEAIEIDQCSQILEVDVEKRTELAVQVPLKQLTPSQAAGYAFVERGINYRDSTGRVLERIMKGIEGQDLDNPKNAFLAASTVKAMDGPAKTAFGLESNDNKTVVCLNLLTGEGLD